MGSNRAKRTFFIFCFLSHLYPFTISFTTQPTILWLSFMVLITQRQTETDRSNRAVKSYFLNCSVVASSFHNRLFLSALTLICKVIITLCVFGSQTFEPVWLFYSLTRPVSLFPLCFYIRAISLNYPQGPAPLTALLHTKGTRTVELRSVWIWHRGCVMLRPLSLLL